MKKNFFKAKVKGNYQDFYVTDLIFKKNKVEARCNCPLKEEWCKHVVALGLTAIDNHIYDEYAEKKYKMQIDYSDEIADPLENPQGSYVFHFNPKRRQNFFSILVTERETGKVVRDLAGLFKKIIDIMLIGYTP